MLLENSAVDNKNSFDFFKKNQIFLNSKLLFYIYYFFFNKNKIVVLSTFNESKFKKVPSIDKLFKSSS